MNSFIFIDESGITEGMEAKQPFFVIGFLKIEEPDLITKELVETHNSLTAGFKAERKKLLKDLVTNPRVVSGNDINLIMRATRLPEYHFTEIKDGDSINKYKSFIDVLFKYKFHFCALTVNKDDPNFSKEIYGDFWKSYVKYIKILCKNNCKKNERCTLIADYVTKPKRHFTDLSKELLKISTVHNVLRCHSHGVPLLQMCDLLTGCVSFELKTQNDTANDSPAIAAKRAVTLHLSKRLGLKNSISFSSNKGVTINNGGKYFSIWPLLLKKKL
ncbi:MAG: DUF3800 domain-containing protein [Patescibacteria group bacterium]